MRKKKSSVWMEYVCQTTCHSYSLPMTFTKLLFKYLYRTTQISS